MQKGNIGVTTENIFPIIKKFLYSDHEIFLRELVSNAVDATQKLKTLAATGDFKGELGDLTVRVKVDKENGTITISDRGLGMTAEEIDKYINQIAFSGANDFLEKYKDDANAIIGHFGLGFYSAFMVAKTVDIVTLSYKEGAKAVKWSCDGSPEFTLEETERSDRGTDIILHVDEDCKEFLEESRLQGLLTKYCHFLAVPVAFGKKKEWKDGKQVETDEDNLINDTCPIWTKKPSDLKEEDYKKFYRDLYPMADEPLFWIHLNVDYPFNLKGILYFPRIRKDFGGQEGQIKLFNRQVFVADNIKEIIPEFLLLLKGVVDCPDLPLNVSRSFLQNDGYVRKLSDYITRKVADRLTGMFKNEREQYESYWKDIHPFIKYGCMRDNKFYDRMKDAIVYKTSKGEYETLAEYLDKAKDTHENKVFYAEDENRQANTVGLYEERGIEVVVMGTPIDIGFMQLIESKNENVHFTRVDADIADALRDSDAAIDADLTKKLEEMFKWAVDDINLKIRIEPLKNEETPAVLLLDENMRRYQEAMRLWGSDGMPQFPLERTLVLNSQHPLVQNLANRPQDDTAKDICLQLTDLAEMAQQSLPAERMNAFISRSLRLMTELATEEKPENKDELPVEETPATEPELPVEEKPEEDK